MPRDLIKKEVNHKKITVHTVFRQEHWLMEVADVCVDQNQAAAAAQTHHDFINNCIYWFSAVDITVPTL